MNARGRAESGLSGWRVAVTRPAEGAAELGSALEAVGAAPVFVPLVRVVPAADPAALAAAAGQLDSYDWIVFTSGNAVRFLRTALQDARLPAGQPAGLRVAAVGSATAAAVARWLDWNVDAMPARYTGAELTGAMAAVAPLRGARVLWPRARDARETLSRDLAAAGALLHAPETYRTEPVPGAAASLQAMARAGRVTAITLTSPSAAVSLATAPPPADTLVAVIGPSTAEAARQQGLAVHVEADPHTIPGLVAALLRHAGGARS